MTEAYIDGLLLKLWHGYSIQTMLEELSHPQPVTPVVTEKFYTAIITVGEAKKSPKKSTLGFI